MYITLSGSGLISRKIWFWQDSKKMESGTSLDVTTAFGPAGLQLLDGKIVVITGKWRIWTATAFKKYCDFDFADVIITLLKYYVWQMLCLQ